MRRRISAIRDEASTSGASIEVGGTAAVPPNRCDRFRPAFFQVGEHLGGFVETPLGRFGDAEVQDPEHAACDLLACKLQTLHRLAERLLDDRVAAGTAAAEGAIQKRLDLVTAAEPPVKLRGVLLVGLAHFAPFPSSSVPSGFAALARRPSSLVRS